MISISSIISRVFGGFLLDKTSEKFVMTIGMLIQGVGMTLMGWLTPETAMICAFIQGLSGGIMQNVTAVAYANFFGRKHLGSIQGFAQSAGVLGSALGPLVAHAIRRLLAMSSLHTESSTRDPSCDASVVAERLVGVLC